MDKELFQILGVTLRMSFFSTTVSCLIGMPLGALIGKGSFRGKKTVKRILHTLMGLPPVVAGLLVYMLFTHYGPFGSFEILYTVKAMVIAQCLLITPDVASLTSSVVSINASVISETAKGLGLSRLKSASLLLTENKTLAEAIYERLLVQYSMTRDEMLSLKKEYMNT